MAANAGGIRAGRAFVEIFTNDIQLQKGLKAAEAKVAAFGQSISKIGLALGALGGAITTPLLAASKTFADMGSTLNDMSVRTGISVEALSTLGFAAAQSGADLGAVEVAIKKMQKALVAGSEENIQAAATFASLGLNVQMLMQLAPEQQFEAIAKAISKIPNPSAKAGAAMMVFGKSGTALLPMINDLSELTAQAREFNLVWTGDEAKKADALGDAFDLLKAVIGRVVSAVGAELAPLLTEIAVALARCARTTIDFVKANGPLIVSAFKIAAGIVAAGAAFLTLGGAIFGISKVFGFVASILGAISTGFSLLFSPIGLLIGGLVALGVVLFKFTDFGSKSLSWLGDRFSGLKETATTAFKGITDALAAGDIALAGKILWAALNVEWLKGLNALQALWSDWSLATVEMFRGISYKIAGVLIDIWPTIQGYAVNALAEIQSAWTEFVGTLMTSWNSFGGFFAKVWERIKAMFTGKDIEAEIQRINDEVAAKNEAVDKETQERLIEISRAQGESNMAIDQGAEPTRKALEDQQKAEIEARRKAAAAALASNAEQLKKAQDELAALGVRAALNVPEPPGAPSAPKFNPEDLDQGLQQAAQKAKVDVAGSFSAAALQGLGAGTSVQDEQLKEQKKQTTQLEKLNRKAAVGQLVFSS